MRISVDAEKSILLQPGYHNLLVDLQHVPVELKEV